MGLGAAPPPASAGGTRRDQAFGTYLVGLAGTSKVLSVTAAAP